MKRFIALAAFMLAFSAHAQWFSISASCQLNRAQAVCQVTNNWPRPLYCRGRVDGISSRGFVGTAWIDRWVGVGQYAQLYLYALSPSDPLLRVQQAIQCRF